MKSASRIFILFMLLLALLLYSLFFTIPSLLTIFMSFFKWSGFGDNINFVGINNYLKSFSDPVFWLSIKNTLTIIVIGGAVNFILAFYFSLVLSSGINAKVRSFYRAVIFLPFIVSAFATVNMWQNLYNPNTGIFKIIADLLGREDSFIFTRSETVLYAMLIAMIWSNIGFYLVILLSGIDKIPQEMFEAADLEGASNWAKFTRITIPLIWDVITISITLWIILAIKDFEFPYAFGSQNIPQELYNTSVYMYITGFGQREPIFQMGYASAIGVESILLAGFLVFFTRRLMRKEIHEF